MHTESIQKQQQPKWWKNFPNTGKAVSVLLMAVSSLLAGEGHAAGSPAVSPSSDTRWLINALKRRQHTEYLP